MKTHSLTIIASGLNPDEAGFEDRFFEAGCSDATLAIQKGLIVVEFDREARSFVSALVTAIRDVQKTGATIERVEPDHLVSASEIAKRSGLGRAAISHYAAGARCEGFPRPVARVISESPLWDWVEVSSWMYHHGKISLHMAVEARFVRAINRAVTLKQAGTLNFERRLGRDLLIA